jgi:hypothetical protein
MLKQYDGRLWNQFIWFRIWISDESAISEKQKVLSEKRKARDHLEDLIVNGWILCKVFISNYCTISLFLHSYMFRLTISAIIRVSTYIDICSVHRVAER